MTLVAVGAAAGVAGCGTADPCDRPTPGVICTIAGSGINDYAGDGGPALEASLSLPMDTLTAADGTVFILDWNNHRVRKVTPDGVIHHVAGTGEPGGTLDDPDDDDLDHPTGMLFDPSGTGLIIAAWHNSQIKRVDLTTGAITDVAGDGQRAYAGDDGPATTASLDLPSSVALDPDSNLVVMDQVNQVLRFIDEAGDIHLLAGQCVIDAPAPAGPGACPDGVAPVACPAPSNKTTCGDPAEFCTWPCTPSYAPGEGSALEMRMAQPFGGAVEPAGQIVYDDAGNLYFADTGNSMIRMIDTDGKVHPIAGSEPVDGVPQAGFAGDGGPALDARLFRPVDVAVGDDGTLYFTDVYNHCVRAVDPAGVIRTVAGVCEQRGFAGDGGPATEALLYRPYGLEVAGDTLLISDTGNDVIRSVLLPEDV